MENIIILSKNPNFYTKYLLCQNLKGVYYVIADFECEEHKDIYDKYLLQKRQVKGGGMIALKSPPLGRNIEFYGRSLKFGDVDNRLAAEIATNDVLCFIRQNWKECYSNCLVVAR